jgi:hypothetical protein
MVNASPWMYENDIEYISIENELRVNCGIKRYSVSSSPQPIESLYNKAKIQNEKYPSEICNKSLKRIKELILNYFSKNNTTIGFQTGADNLYTQERGQRYPHDKSIFLLNSQVIDKFSYKLNISKNNKGYNFDGTEFSYLISKNSLIRFGAFDRWWSPSYFRDTKLPINSL